MQLTPALADTPRDALISARNRVTIIGDVMPNKWRFCGR